MAAYNFQKQFVTDIENWNKRHTIRRIGKRHHSKPGDRIQLYTGMRTKSCRKIINPDPLCIYVRTISIWVNPEGIRLIQVDKFTQDDLESFAKSDGFENLKSMSDFWLDFHGTGRFDGLIIGWAPRLKSHFKRAEQSNWKNPIIPGLEVTN